MTTTNTTAPAPAAPEIITTADGLPIPAALPPALQVQIAEADAAAVAAIRAVALLGRDDPRRAAAQAERDGAVARLGELWQAHCAAPPIRQAPATAWVEVPGRAARKGGRGR